MTPTVLVVTTVHHPDDTRIRERLIRTLTGIATVLYAAKVPGPTDDEGLRWVPLAGGRLARNTRAFGALVRGRWDVAVVHDPELVPAAVVARVVRRRPVVFDVHEDLPAQIASKEWIPGFLRPVARLSSRGLLALAERVLTITLAEDGYRGLFRSEHMVFPNYPREIAADPVPSGDGSAIYVGDVTEARGVSDAVQASAMAGVPIAVVGPVSEGMREKLVSLATACGAELELVGRLPHAEAMGRVASASVGLSPLRAEPNYMGSLPTKTLEYLALGVPVVASDLPGTRAHIGELAAVELVEPGSVPALAAAITASTTPEVKQAAMDQVGEVRSRFRWPDADVEGFYGDLLNR